ncbi:MAG: GTPase HflX [Tissierellia bacterium]|nr:GTPase HflX [Tissierellia bacterium]
MRERTLIVGLALPRDNRIEQSMDELERLVDTAGGEVIGRIVQVASKINPSTYVGKGKVAEIQEMAAAMEIELVVINHELSGSQIRNLEEATEVKILDRTGLILDIFASRARTGESILQVQLAQAEYMLPRLVGYRNYLSRTGGGIGTRGPGEQKLETDRRHIRRQIDAIKGQLEKRTRNREVKGRQRKANATPVVSMVGYTNAGKSTLMNEILGSAGGATDKLVYADDRLFATLDTSHRRIETEGRQPFVLSDTVGFVKDIPIHLIEAFQSTLDELHEADLILFVLDASTNDLELQKEAMREVLDRLDVHDAPILEVYNKMDMVSDQLFLVDPPKNDIERIFISALKSEDIARLLEKIEELLTQDQVRRQILLPYARSDLLGNLLGMGVLLERRDEEDGIYLDLRIRKEDLARLEKLELIADEHL